MTALVTRVRDVLSAEGATAVARRALAKVIDVRGQVLLECDLRQRPDASPPAGIAMSWATLDQLRGIPEWGLFETAGVRATTERRLASGDRCVLVRLGEAPAAYLWLTTRYRELPRLRWPVREGAVFVYKTFTGESFRGRGLNRTAVTWALQQYYDLGCRTAFVDVDRYNEASLKALRAAGFVDVAHFRTIKIGPVLTTQMSDHVYARVSGRPGRQGS